MMVTSLEPDFIMDEGKDIEIMYSAYKDTGIPNKFFYTKSTISNIDFNDNVISNIKNYIKISSLWLADLTTKTKIEIIPFGNFDIIDALVIGDYLYYRKITDKDHDGILKKDYDRGDIYRINISTFKQELCCHIDLYDFFQYETADNQFLIYDCEEDNSDNMYVMIIDIINKRRAILINSFGCTPESIHFEFILNDHNLIESLIIKKYVEEGEIGSSDDKLGCIMWDRLLKCLRWEDME